MTLLYLSLAYLLGIAAGRLLWNAGLFGCGFPDWPWLLALAALPLPALWRRWVDANTGDNLRWPISAGFTPPVSGWSGPLATAVLLAACAGLLRYASAPELPCPTPADLAFYHSAPESGGDAPPHTLRGFVDNYPTVKNGRQQIDLWVESIQIDGVAQPVQGRARLSVSSRSRYSYGDPVAVTGQIAPPPILDTFDYRAYLARKGIHSQILRARMTQLDGPSRGNLLFRWLYGLRARGEAVVNRLLPEPHASLANGMLLGIEAGIPDALYEEFNLTGTSHVIVISGSNVAIVAGVLAALFVRLWGRRRALWPTLVGVGLYALLVGGDAAVVRAALMGSLFVVSTTLGRRSTALISLAAACWAMTLLNPLTLWDVGFQLSSGATAGLILFSPGLTAGLSRMLPGLRWGGPLTGEIFAKGSSLLYGLVQDGLLITLAANITTLPLVAYHFGRLSLVSPLTNLLIAPAQPFIMLWGGAGLLTGVAGLSLVAQPLLWVPYLCLWWTVEMVRWTAALPWASLEVSGYDSGGLLMTYGLIFGWRWRQGIAGLLGRWPAFSLHSAGRWTVRMGLPGLAIVALLLWQILLSRPDGRLHVDFLDIGQGDGILIQTPGGRQILIDGGSDPQRLHNQLGAVLPFWDRSLDLVIATHPDLDHMGGQTGLSERFSVERALVSGTLAGHEDFAEWQQRMTGSGAAVGVQSQGGWIDLGDGAGLWVLWPPPEGGMPSTVEADDKNERSLVMRLVYGEFSLLLTGDAGLPVEESLLEAGWPVTAPVLKVGHHGSRSSTGADFIDAVAPVIAIIQVGENRYGHPDESVLETLAGRVLLRNDLHGRIRVSSDGEQMWLEAEKLDAQGWPASSPARSGAE